MQTLGGNNEDETRLPPSSPRLHRRVSSFSCGVVPLAPLHRNSFSYDVLPQTPVKLIIWKLDGSCFEVEVSKTATVGELKHAVEEVFAIHLQEGYKKISWAHVWGHFCLSFDGCKLLSDTDSIRDYMITDGDQLQFVHVSDFYKSISRKQSMENLLTPDKPRVSSSKSDDCLVRQIFTEKEEVFNDHGNSPSRYIENEKIEGTPRYGFSISQMLGRWFAYRRLVVPPR